MENLKFYHVEIGIWSRSGNLTVHNSFVCKTDKSKTQVDVHYSKQYSGFGIKVTEIQSVSEPEILDTNVNDKFINELVKENKELKQNQTKKSFKGSLHYTSLSEENKIIYKALIEKEKELNSLRKELKEGILSQLQQKYRPFFSEIRVEKSINTNSDSNADYIVILNGELS